jgi:hypothetical protein
MVLHSGIQIKKKFFILLFHSFAVSLQSIRLLIMIDIITVAQTKAFARQDGAFLALLWIVAFFCTLFIPEGSFGRLLTLSTPFFVMWRLISFRDYALEGVISYRKALYYSVFTFLYASFIFAVIQFIYFRFFDNGQFMSFLNSVAMNVIQTYKEQGVDMRNSIYANISPLQQLSPLNLAFVLMIQNIILGFIMSVGIAFIGRIIKRKQKI